MKKRVIQAAIVLSLVMMVGPGNGGKAHAGFRERHYDVYYNCIISPPYTGLVGQWDVDCDGNWTGWGWMPGDNCTRTESYAGAYCGPEYPEYP
jgi:hypothetical protein